MFLKSIYRLKSVFEEKSCVRQYLENTFNIVHFDWYAVNGSKGCE